MFQTLKKRIPNNQIYDIFFTIIIAIFVVLVIYSIIPNNHYCLYYIGNRELEKEYI